MRIITRTGYGNQLQSCLVQSINHILQPRRAKYVPYMDSG